jgi:hypothetical protein
MKGVFSSQKEGVRVLAVLCACIFILVLNAAATPACECKAESPERAIKRLRKTATVIIVGTVIEVNRVVKNNHVAYWATFKVKQSWKSNQLDEISVFTEGGCMAWFETGRTYIIYAGPDSAKRLSTNVCMRTGLIEYAEEDLRLLGKPQFTSDVTSAECKQLAPR